MERRSVSEHPARRLPLWVAVAVAVSFVGPTLAMSADGQGAVGTVGKAVPLIFLIGLIGVGLVGYGFIRLTRRLNHAGSVYALVGVTVGPRAGFFAGFAMLGAYLAFVACLIGLLATFTNAFLVAIHGGAAGAPQVSWLIVSLISVASAIAITAFDTKVIGLILIVIEGLGILGMLVLVGVIFAKGGAPSTGIDFSTFSIPSGIGFSGVTSGVVIAFLAWAGFESCAALGEETDNPQRNIPRALVGTLAITGVLFVVVMFAQTIGFGTDDAGLQAFGSSSNSIGDLGTTYVGQGFGIAMIFAGMISVFACLLASGSSAGRILFAFARDGFTPSRLAKLDGPSQTARDATWTALIIGLVINIVMWATDWPVLGSGIPSLDGFIMTGTAGAVMLMVAYMMAEVAAVVFATAGRFRAIRDGRGAQLTGIVLPAIGFLVIAVVLWFNVKGQDHPFSSPAYLGLTWCALGLVGAISATKVIGKMGTSLAEELGLQPGPDAETDVPVLR